MGMELTMPDIVVVVVVVLVSMTCAMSVLGNDKKENIFDISERLWVLLLMPNNAD